MIKLCNLSSGSSGNATLLIVDGAKILVDCGISGAVVEREMEYAGYSASDLDAILVTHEHIDHIKSVGVMHRRYNLPIYATKGTILSMISQIGKVDEDKIKYIDPYRPFMIKDAIVTAFSTPHDASQSVGYRFEYGNKTAAVATDIGEMTTQVFDNIKNSDILLLEANHDINMLLNGSYPYHLKKRIMSGVGHLSNRDCASTCVALLQNGVKHVLLGHISEENNMPGLAYKTVSKELEKVGAKIGVDINLSLANRYSASKVLCV